MNSYPAVLKDKVMGLKLNKWAVMLADSFFVAVVWMVVDLATATLYTAYPPPLIQISWILDTSIISCKVFVHNAFPLRICFLFAYLYLFCISLEIPEPIVSIYNTRLFFFFLVDSNIQSQWLVLLFFSESPIFFSFDLHIHWLRGSDWVWTWIWIWKKDW